VFSFQVCDVAALAQGDLAMFGYRPVMQVEIS
jgi:hypothetical protein